MAGVGCRKAGIALAVLQSRSASIKDKECRHAHHETVSKWKKLYPREMRSGVALMDRSVESCPLSHGTVCR